MRRLFSRVGGSMAAAAAVVGLAAGLSAQGGAMELKGVGFATPESVLHDAERDVYIVSNINGVPSDKDGNGFLSLVSPDGQVRTLKWVAGGQGGATLHAPKGMAIVGDTLAVADIDCVRRFQLPSGKPAGDTCIDGATFLNDVAADTRGTLYVTDTGIRISAAGVQQTGTDAVYRIGSDGKPVAIAKGDALQRPNGIVAVNDGVIVVPFGGKHVLRLDRKGTLQPGAEMPAGQLDGVVRLADGTLLVTSWEGKAIYRAPAGGTVTTIASDVPSPADIGFDVKRRRLLVPVFTEDRVLIQPVQ